MKNLIEKFIKDAQKVVELSIAMHIEDINKNTDTGIKKALNYVLDAYKKNGSPLPEDILVVAIKTALAMSLKEQGYVDNKFNANILRSIKTL